MTIRRPSAIGSNVLSALAGLASAALCLAVLAEPAWSADIFIPPPRGADETIDEDGPNGSPVRDMVLTTSGDQLKGHVTSIDRLGKLRLRSPYFDGEARLTLSKLKRITFSPMTRTAGRDRISLGNDDHIAGELVSISDTDIIMESVVAGFIRIPLGAIRSISPSSRLQRLLDCDFRSGVLEPWRQVQGMWAVRSGMLTCQHDRSGRQAVLAANLPQREALTLELRLAGDTDNVNIEVALFSDGTEEGTGRNCIRLAVRNSTAQVYRVTNSSTRPIGSGSWRQVPGQDLQILFAYDPGSGKVNVRANSTDVWDGTISAPLKSGTHVVLTSRYNLSVKHIYVRPGMLTSSGAEARADPENDTVFLSDGSRMAADSITLNNNLLTIETAVGPLTCPLKDVAEILFSTAGQQPVKAPQADVVVRAGGNRLTLKLESMGRQHLTGTSAMIGRVSIARDAIEEIAVLSPR